MSYHRLLLIVPYGIETQNPRCLLLFPTLLIVPYGIETEICFNHVGTCTLLIVPYGIETKYSRMIVNHLIELLIVPYGIETSDKSTSPPILITFNRTLWN